MPESLQSPSAEISGRALLKFKFNSALQIIKDGMRVASRTSKLQAQCILARQEVPSTCRCEKESSYVVLSTTHIAAVLFVVVSKGQRGSLVFSFVLSLSTCS